MVSDAFTVGFNCPLTIRSDVGRVLSKEAAMRIGSSVDGFRLLPAVIRPDWSAAAPALDNSHASTATDVRAPTALATYLTPAAHLVRIAF